MKISVRLCFCLFLSVFVLYVTDTLAMLRYNRTGLNFGDAFQNEYSSYKIPRAKEPVETLSPMEKKKRNTEINPKPLEENIVQLQFDQKLDHYNSTDTQYFKQTYFVYKDDNYVRGNPVFLLVGGAGELEPSELTEGIWNHFARESNALLIGLEHRMYGKSHPAIQEYSTDILEYLNSEQALADLVYFKDELVLNNPKGVSIAPDATWIALGSSYGGTLAARLKLKFSHHVKGVVAANAPLYPTSALKEFYKNVEIQCAKEKIDETIRDAFAELQGGFKSCDTSDGSRECYINEFVKHHDRFNLCDVSLTPGYDIKTHKAFLIWSLTTILGQALTFGNENGQSVRTEVINILLDKDNIPNALDRFGSAVKLMLKRHDINCIITDLKIFLDKYRDPSLNAEEGINYILYTALGNRQIFYQHCSEWGYFDTAYKENGLFPKHITIHFYIIICQYAFGRFQLSRNRNDVRNVPLPQFDADYMRKALKTADMLYGGREINVGNVLFIMRDDFWTHLGFSGRKPRDKIAEDDSVAIMIKKGDGEQTISKELIDDWNYVLRTLKNWTGGKKNVGKNRL